MIKKTTQEFKAIHPIMDVWEKYNYARKMLRNNDNSKFVEIPQNRKKVANSMQMELL